MVLVATQVKRRRGTTAENDAFTGAEGEIVVDIERHELRVHDGVTQGGFKIGGGSGAMPVGAIFTTPRTGTIEGAVEANGSPYNIADYSGDGSIGALLTAGNIAYVSKAEFQTQVTNTGACDSFGWDGTSDTTFLVPKLKPWHVGKNAPVVGNGKALRFTDADGGGNTGSAYYSNTLTLVKNTGDIGSIANENVGIVKKGQGDSGMIADLSETTNLCVMVQLATGATDQALETCTSVLSDVSALNAHRVIEFQAPTTANGYTWYRKYADGWVEQGGIYSITDVTFADFNLIVPMADSNYTATGNSAGVTTNAFPLSFNRSAFTTTTFSAKTGNASTGDFYWYVSGMAA